MGDVALLAIGAVVLIVALSRVSSRLGVAAPLLLTAAGIGYSFLPGARAVDLPPEVVLDVILPVLVYATAVQTPLTAFRRELRVIVGLSVGLVVLSAFAVAAVLLVLLPGIPFGVALAVGAVVSPTDAVAATTVAKRLGLPAAIVTILEGESLVNDASALTLLRTALVSIGGVFSGWRLAGEFGYSVGAALLIGGLVGAAGLAVRSRLSDTVSDTVISFVLPFLAFVPTQAIGGSGVVATVTAGLVGGTAGPRYLGARARVSERLNWRTVQFLLEGGVFLLMGAQLAPILLRVTSGRGTGPGAGASFGAALVVVVVLLVARAAVVFALIAGSRREARAAPTRIRRLRRELDVLDRQDARGPGRQRTRSRRRRAIERRVRDLRRFEPSDLRWRGGVVATAAGMRGVVTLAAAQSIPPTVPARDQLVLLAFVVAASTLLAQGATLPAIVRATGMRGSDGAAEERQAASLVADLTAAASNVLDHPGRDREGRAFDTRMVDEVRAQVGRNRARAMKSTRLRDDREQIARSQRDQLLARVADAVQETLSDAQARGEYSADVLRRAQESVDHDHSAPAFPTETD